MRALLLNLAVLGTAEAFTRIVPRVANSLAHTQSWRSSQTRVDAANASPIDSLLARFGDIAASAIVDSPFSPTLVKQAKHTMKGSAKSVGIQWDEQVEQLQQAQDWDKALANVLDEGKGVEVPLYYKQPFHAYKDGNLGFEAAFEQELAGKAVGVRNFPDSGLNGEYVLRASYDRELLRLGAAVEDGGLVVDMGCGTGTSSRYIAKLFPQAQEVRGYDLSAHFVAVGQYLLSEEGKMATDGTVFGEVGEVGPEAAAAAAATAAAPEEAPISIHYGDVADIGLPDESASLVNICFVVHELPDEARRAIFREAFRLLKPGGSVCMMEMDPETPGYRALRSNPFVFSLMRATEPYLEDYFASAESVASELQEVGFSFVRQSAATGRHFALLAGKSGYLDLRPSAEERQKSDLHTKMTVGDIVKRKEGA